MQGGVSSFSSLTCLGCAWPKFWKRTQLTMTWASGGRWSSQYELAHISHRNSRPPAACAEHGASAQTPGAPGTGDPGYKHVLAVMSCAAERGVMRQPPRSGSMRHALPGRVYMSYCLLRTPTGQECWQQY